MAVNTANMEDLYDDIESTSTYHPRTDSPNSSSPNTPPPYDPESIVRSESTLPLYQPSGLIPSTGGYVAMLSCNQEEDDQDVLWCPKTRDEVWIDLEKTKNQLVSVEASKVNPDYTESPNNVLWYEPFYGQLDQQGMLSLENDATIEALPRIDKIVIITKPYIDNTGTFEMVYPLMLPYPITFETFFTHFREGQPPVDRFILACFRRKLRTTFSTARLFLSTFGLLDYQSYVTQLHIETATKSKVPIAVAQECPYKLGLNRRTGSITLTVHATIQAHFNNISPSAIEPTMQHLYQLDHKNFERDRDFLINSLKEFQPMVRPKLMQEPMKNPVPKRRFRKLSLNPALPDYTDYNERRIHSSKYEVSMPKK